MIYKGITELLPEVKEKNVDYWLPNSKFNKLLNEAEEVRLTEQGKIELCFEEEIKLGVELGEILVSSIDPKDDCHVMILYLNKNGENLYKWSNEILISLKEAKIL